MVRRIIQIDRDACNGCGLCVGACHEGAIGLVDGKAQLLRDDYCDGLGDCLPACPTGAITFVEREAVPYDQQAVLASKKTESTAPAPYQPSRLENWPVQIKLAPIRSPMLDGEKLLIAATCSAYAYEAICKYGAMKGGWLALKRLLRCHPFYKGDWYDPVP